METQIPAIPDHGIRRSALSLLRESVAGGGWQSAHGRAGASIGKDEVILRLKVQPELRLSPKPVPEPEGGVAGYGTLPRDNLADSVRRRVNLASERRWGHAQLSKFVSENFPRMHNAL